MKLSMKMTSDGLVRALRWDRELMLEAIMGQKKRKPPTGPKAPTIADRRARLRRSPRQPGPTT